jgi:2'-5' RNA ligase
VKHVVYLNLDTDSSGVITEFWSTLGIVSEVPPHITLASFDNSSPGNGAKISTLAQSMAAAQPVAPTVRFVSFGMFPGKDRTSLFLAPVVDVALLDFHKKFHELAAKDGLQNSKLYSPGNWVPHCTLDERGSDQDVDQMITAAFGRLKGHMPIQARLDAFEVLEVGDTSVKSLARHKMK